MRRTVSLIIGAVLMFLPVGSAFAGAANGPVSGKTDTRVQVQKKQGRKDTVNAARKAREKKRKRVREMRLHRKAPAEGGTAGGQVK